MFLNIILRVKIIKEDKIFSYKIFVSITYFTYFHYLVFKFIGESSMSLSAITLRLLIVLECG